MFVSAVLAIHLEVASQRAKQGASANIHACMCHITVLKQAPVFLPLTCDTISMAKAPYRWGLGRQSMDSAMLFA